MAVDISSEHAEAKRLVEECLESDPRCRNSDMWLLLSVWQKKQHIKMFVPYDELQDMIAAETITRVRRKIQNDECRHLPTDPNVLRMRRFNEAKVREYYGNKQDERSKFILAEYERQVYGME